MMKLWVKKSLITMLMQERIDIFNKYPKFARELEMYMDQIDKN